MKGQPSMMNAFMVEWPIRTTRNMEAPNGGVRSPMSRFSVSSTQVAEAPSGAALLHLSGAHVTGAVVVSGLASLHGPNAGWAEAHLVYTPAYKPSLALFFVLSYFLLTLPGS
jgi:hypothetical protein